MKPDLLDELRAADPARAHPPAADPDWQAMARQILATPRHAKPVPAARRRRSTVVLALSATAALVAVAIVALLPGGTPPSALERAYAAVSQSAVYHYVVTTQELEGPRRRPLADTRASAEGWIDPTTGEIHEISSHGDEWASDGRHRTLYTAFNNTLQSYDEPLPVAGTPQQPANEVLTAMTRTLRAGVLRDEGVETLEGRQVRRLVAVNPDRTWRQTFLVDAETYLPVLFRHETGDYVRDGGPIPADQRVIEQRFERFERLPDGTSRSVLELRPHPGAKAPSQTIPRGPAAAPPPARPSTP